jgi:broad-specificity NMP kinase
LSTDNECVSNTTSTLIRRVSPSGVTWVTEPAPAIRRSGAPLRRGRKRAATTAYAVAVRKILVTGMSGTGKSTALAALARRGFAVVETDRAPWSEWSEHAGGHVWNEELVGELLEREHETPLYVSGTVSNQGRFYPRFDAVVLLSAPAHVLLRRIESRETNEFGKAVDERERVIRDIADVEPLLRATCTHEIDATRSVAAVVAELAAIGENAAPASE